MFFVVNTTKQSLSISDLKIVLGPRQGIDLDVKHSRDQVDKSKGLKSLISKGLVTVKNKTEPQYNNLQPVQEIHNHNHNHNDINLNQMKEEIMSGLKDIIVETIKSQAVNQPSSQNTGNIGIEQLTEMLNNISSQKTQSSTCENDVSINSDLLADIHSRAVNKIAQGIAHSEVKGEISKSKNDIDNNINELEGLLE